VQHQPLGPGFSGECCDTLSESEIDTLNECCLNPFAEPELAQRAPQVGTGTAQHTGDGKLVVVFMLDKLPVE